MLLSDLISTPLSSSRNCTSLSSPTEGASYLSSKPLIASKSFLSRIDGIILMIFFILFMNYTIGLAKANKEKMKQESKYSVPVVVTRHSVNAGQVTPLVHLVVYDILGKEVATLVNAYQPAGEYEVVFNAENLPSGTYFYKLESGTFSETKKLLLLK